MTDKLKTWSVVLNWQDGDTEQGTYGATVRAADWESAELAARRHMRAAYIDQECLTDDDEIAEACSMYEDDGDPDTFGGSVVECSEGAIWKAKDMEDALRAIVARIKGEFDNPALMKLGALGMTNDDILAIADPIIAEIDAL